MSKYAWTGVVLAGGKSTRMGQDKALLVVDGRPMLARAIDQLRPHVRELLVIGDPRKYGAFHPDVVPDDLEGLGPLGGIVTAMGHARHDRLLVLACDVIGVNAALFQRLQRGLPDEGDAFVPRHEGLIEPLVAAYHRRCADAFLGRLRSNDLSMRSALAEVSTSYLDLVPGTEGWPADLFRNLNGPDDL